MTYPETENLPPAPEGFDLDTIMEAVMEIQRERAAPHARETDCACNGCTEEGKWYNRG